MWKMRKSGDRTYRQRASIVPTAVGKAPIAQYINIGRGELSKPVTALYHSGKIVKYTVVSSSPCGPRMTGVQRLNQTRSTNTRFLITSGPDFHLFIQISLEGSRSRPGALKFLSTHGVEVDKRQGVASKAAFVTSTPCARTRKIQFCVIFIIGLVDGGKLSPAR
jgi:hypothetical protein